MEWVLIFMVVSATDIETTTKRFYTEGGCLIEGAYLAEQPRKPDEGLWWGCGHIATTYPGKVIADRLPKVTPRTDPDWAIARTGPPQSLHFMPPAKPLPVPADSRPATVGETGRQSIAWVMVLSWVLDNESGAKVQGFETAQDCITFGNQLQKWADSPRNRNDRVSFRCEKLGDNIIGDLDTVFEGPDVFRN